MSDNDQNRDRDISKLKPEELMVNMGGKQVPFSKINKPHHVILDPQHHQPKVEAESFPDVEPQAKLREEELEARHRAAHKYTLDPYAHKPEIDPEQFPPVDPDLEKTAEKVRANNQKTEE